MADFKAAFQAGLGAFDEGQRGAQEIQQVLTQFSRQLHEATQGKVEVSVPAPGTTEEETNPLVDPRISGMLTSLRASRRFHPLLALGPRTATGQRHQADLAEITLPTAGYPVTLRQAGQEVSCPDRASLETALEQLLRHPDTGARLHRLLTGQ